VIRANQRVTLALHAVPCDETLVATLTYLLAQLATLEITIARLYLDRGFYNVPIIPWLQALDIPLAIVNHDLGPGFCESNCDRLANALTTTSDEEHFSIESHAKPPVGGNNQLLRSTEYTEQSGMSV
jgi:hypothetical protein